MTIINSSTTGHSRPEEKKIARDLYVGIVFVVIVALILAFMIGKNYSINPNRVELQAPESSTSESKTR